MTEITTDLEDLTQKDLTVQMVLRMDRNYNRKFEHGLATEDAAGKLAEATALIETYATALTDAGFPEIADQVLKVVA